MYIWKNINKKWLIYFFKIFIIIISIFVFYNLPSHACLSCGCGTSGASSDLGTVSGAAGIFAKNKKFLIQVGSSLKNANGSFNELGQWNQKPVDSQLGYIQNTISLLYFPSNELSFDIQIPLIINFQSKAGWGNFGSIAATDFDFVSGMSLSDISTQVTYKILEENNFALVPWLKGDFPTGQSSGKPENITGSGVFKLNGGIMAIKTLNKLEFIINLGYQQPLGMENTKNSFSTGNEFQWQINSNYQFNEKIKAGIGINGYLGIWQIGNKQLNTGKINLTASGQYDLSIYNGIGISTGIDPVLIGTNSSTSTNFNLVFFQFF